MTTAVTVKCVGTPVYIYQALLDEDQNGEFTLCATLEESGDERTFYIHKTVDVMVTENKLAD